MADERFIISPQTRVGALLDAYPELEKVLMELSPAFAKLQNPVLRKTVARVATLQQAAIVGGLSVEMVVNHLRKAAGQDHPEGLPEGVRDEDAAIVASLPEWFDADWVVRRFDARPLIDSGKSPMAEILSLTRSLGTDECLELVTSFVPAPIIDQLRTKGFKVFSLREGEQVRTYFVNTSNKV